MAMRAMTAIHGPWQQLVHCPLLFPLRSSHHRHSPHAAPPSCMSHVPTHARCHPHTAGHAPKMTTLARRALLVAALLALAAHVNAESWDDIVERYKTSRGTPEASRVAAANSVTVIVGGQVGSSGAASQRLDFPAYTRTNTMCQLCPRKVVRTADDHSNIRIWECCQAVAMHVHRCHRTLLCSPCLPSLPPKTYPSSFPPAPQCAEF